MAVADGLIAPPPSPPPAASWNIAASLARRHLGRTAADAVTGALVFVSLTCVWIFGASAALSIVGRRACGEGSAVVAVASRVTADAFRALLFAGVPLVVLVAIRMACFDSDSVSPTVAEEDGQAHSPKSIATLVRELLCDTVGLAVVASMAFIFVMCVGEILKCFSVKGSHRERIASLISDVGIIGAGALFCLLILPVSVVRVWKSWKRP